MLNTWGLCQKNEHSTKNEVRYFLRSLSLSLIPANISLTSSLPAFSIKKEGRVVPQESTLEINTRVSRRPIELPEVASQIWISQTPKLVRAHHQGGQFSTPEVEDVTTSVEDWEKDSQDEIRKLVALIKRILQVKRSWDGSLTVRYDPLKDKLVIIKTKRKNMLPNDLYCRWRNIPIVPTKIPGSDKRRTKHRF